MIARNLLVVSTAGLAAVVLAASLAAAAPTAKDRLAPTGLVKAKGEKVLVGGTVSQCEAGDRLSIRLRVRQGERVARGRHGAECAGEPHHWHALLERAHGGRLDRGPAQGRAIVEIERDGRTVATRELRRRLELSRHGHPLGDYPVYGAVTLAVGAGVRVEIIGGGAGPSNSNCTRDETVSSFTTKEDSERHVFEITARNGGGCFDEPSYSNFRVNVNGPGVQGTGRLWLGQHTYGAGSYFFTSCFSGTNKDVVHASYYEWSGLRCEKTGDWELKVTK